MVSSSSSSPLLEGELPMPSIGKLEEDVEVHHSDNLSGKKGRAIQIPNGKTVDVA